ncbi:hypothetical protein [Bradyrhizobium amphicarpaeae]|uniref:hypothetical protein n=1 Tax=Bradyrhizobium amphicarpaeae TaxID=1404768 RepID=UPI0013905F18|nr:hypothetical protein [Bradyrhizobium amphicarpaeae]
MTDKFVTSFSFLDATLARILGGKLHPIDGDATAESPSRDSRKTAARRRSDQRSRH